ncbi:MAG TPA: type II toxin-antitoxin system VapC family toxin [Candidatus Desulfobacillus sp.]|nr:type II toxin-antitoxin system VapC family toxin [Candidatus Desulfobacillus sp.]
MNFWDSSAVLPLIVQESSSVGLREFHSSNPEAVAWWGMPVECSSALARLEREGGLEPSAVTEALHRLNKINESWHEVQPLDGVRETAARLLRVHPLRSADALQLAAALVACEHRTGAWQFICLDARLCAAAEREGFKVVREF